jgi:hypothetical protein
MRHTSSANSDPLAMKADAVWQIRAQALSSSMHRDIILTSRSFKHAVAQCSHSEAQRLQAWIQDSYFSCIVILSDSIQPFALDEPSSLLAMAVPMGDGQKSQGRKRQPLSFLKELSNYQSQPLELPRRRVGALACCC